MSIEFKDPPEAPLPAANYRNLAIVTPGKRLLIISGQIGNRLDGSIIEGLEAQYEQAVRRKIEEANILSWSKVLLVRMFLLGDCDWTQLGDNGLTDEKKAMWLAYRKWIRDNPKTNAQGQDAETA